MLSHRYKKNLKQLFVVQATWWVKLVLKFFRPFISAKFWKYDFFVFHVISLICVLLILLDDVGNLFISRASLSFSNSWILAKWSSQYRWINRKNWRTSAPSWTKWSRSLAMPARLFRFSLPMPFDIFMNMVALHLFLIDFLLLIKFLPPIRFDDARCVPIIRWRLTYRCTQRFV